MDGLTVGESRGASSALRSKVVRVLLAAMMAMALVPAMAAEQAFAAEPTFVGSVYYPVLYDENGYPLYNEDGTFQRGNPVVNLDNVENVSGALVIPASFDVVVRAEDGTELKVEKGVKPYSITLGGSKSLVGSMGEDNWKNGAITSIDLTQCSTIAVLDASRLAKVESLDLSGLSNLATVGLYRCAALSSVNTEGCEKLSWFSMMNCDALAAPDFSQPQWRGLTFMQFRSQRGIGDLDVTNLTELTNLSLSDTDLSSIDVSRCSKLKELSLSGNQLTALDAASVPSSVERFDCRDNRIPDTDALVARFGEDAVLPQGGSSVSSGVKVYGLQENSQGTMLPGDEYGFGLTDAYRPSGDESSKYYQEDGGARNDAANFKATSSDPSVVKVEVAGEPMYPELRIRALKAGTTTLTVEYAFEGSHGTYVGKQVVDFVVAASENPLVGVSCDTESVEVPLPGTCAICGEAHETYGVDVPFTKTAQDPSRPLTGSAEVEVKSSDESVVTGYQGMYNNAPSVRLIPKGLGTATVTLRGVRYVDGLTEYTDPVSFAVTVSNAPNPTLNVAESVTVFPSERSEGTDVNISPVVSPYSGIASYADDEALGLVRHWHGSGFEFGDPKVFEGAPDIYRASSDNEAVVSVVYDEKRSQLVLENKAAGTARVTVEDIWGNKGTCTVKVLDKKEEAKKLSLSQRELTIKQGEAFDLSTLVEGMDQLDPAIAKSPELLVFKSSNGYIAPIKWNLDGNLDDSLPHYVSQIFGRTVGEVTVSANMLTTDDMGGSLEYIDKWGVEQFGILTVHVVPAETPSNPATAVEVTGASDTVEMGSSLQLSAAITPADATDAGTLAWSSSDEGVATVDASGKVTPVAPGTAAITATVGPVSGTFEVTVVERAVPAESVSISEAEEAMNVGGKQKLTATVEPADSTDVVEWSSSDEKVLTVDQDGLVTAVGNGTATIVARAGAAEDETRAITVTTPVTGVSLDASALELYAGAQASKLGATVEPATASNKAVTWASSNEGVATVDAEGNVTPVAAGTAAITATTADGGFSASCTVTVKQRATGLALDKHELVLTGAQKTTLTATVEPNNATNKNVAWTSSDEAVATVDAEGNVAAVGKGSARITATSEDGAFSDACDVTVKNPVTAVALDPSALALVKGQTADVSVALSGELPGAVDAVDAAAWSSSDGSVAAVADGTVTAMASGSATVTYEATVGGAKIVGTCAVTVTNPVQAVTISETAKTATVGDAPFTLTATVDPADADDTAITWSSSNPAVAEVSADGKVVIKAAGSASISASAGGKSAACALVVNAREIAKTPEGAGFAASVTATDAATVEKLGKLVEEGLNLVVKAVEDLTAPAKEAIDALTADGAVVAETFDIHFAKDNGDEITLSTDEDGGVKLTVRVKLTDAMRALLDEGMELQVHYVGDDGTVEDKQTWVDGDFLYFVTDHFSDYVVTGVPTPEEPATPPTDDQKPLVPTDGGNDQAKDGGSKLAPTGDPLGAAVLGIGALACCAGIAIALVRRRMAE